MIQQRHRRTDRRTDDMRSQNRALHYDASRGKKWRHWPPKVKKVNYGTENIVHEWVYGRKPMA